MSAKKLPKVVRDPNVPIKVRRLPGTKKPPVTEFMIEESRLFVESLLAKARATGAWTVTMRDCKPGKGETEIVKRYVLIDGTGREIHIWNRKSNRAPRWWCNNKSFGMTTYDFSLFEQALRGPVSQADTKPINQITLPAA